MLSKFLRPRCDTGQLVRERHPLGKKYKEADRWIREPVKRLTLGMPVGLHARFKIECSREGITMKGILLDFWNKKFPEQQ